MALRRVALAAAMLAAACGPASERAGGEAAAPASASAGGGGPAIDYAAWDSYLGGPESSQYSSLSQIDRTNVGKLEVAWTYEIGEGQATRFNPIVVDGVMYVQGRRSALIALDAATGAEIWRLDVKGRAGDRGINYWRSADGKDARLFLLVNGELTAVDAKTGTVIESFGTKGKVDLRAGLRGDPSDVRPLQTDNPGRVFEDLVIMSLPAGNFGYASSPGDVHAYDARTGALRWVFHVVPLPGEPGGDTWPAQDRELFGGGHNWSEITVDPEAGIVYVPTGTARYDFYGGNRPGNNLFTDSLVALDARTGKRIWHFQDVHHGLWDYDLPTGPRLLTLTRGGEEIPALVQPTKQGFLFTLNRLTGEPVFPIEERPVPPSDVPGEHVSPTQPFPTAPPPYTRQSFVESDIDPYLPEEAQQKLRELFQTARHEGLFTPPSLQGTLSLPGHQGGATWGSVAADPARARVYVVARHQPVLERLVPPAPGARPQQAPAAPEGFVAYDAPRDFLVQPGGLPPISPPWSTITAYDMNEGRILWQVPNGTVMTLDTEEDTGAIAPRGGPVATAGGLLFVATATDRKLRARDADTGAVLWDYDLPAASEGVPAVYEVDGREYVTIPVGGNGQFTEGLPLPEPGPGQYITFALPKG